MRQSVPKIKWRAIEKTPNLNIWLPQVNTLVREVGERETERENQ